MPDAANRPASDGGFRPPARFAVSARRRGSQGHLLKAGYDTRVAQAQLAHSDLATTRIHTHVLNRGGLGVKSPLDTTPEE